MEELCEKSPYSLAFPTTVESTSVGWLCLKKKKKAIWDFCPQIALMLSSAYSSKRERKSFLGFADWCQSSSAAESSTGIELQPRVFMSWSRHGKFGAWWLGTFLVSPNLFIW